MFICSPVHVEYCERDWEKSNRTCVLSPNTENFSNNEQGSQSSTLFWYFIFTRLNLNLAPSACVDTQRKAMIITLSISAQSHLKLPGDTCPDTIDKVDLGWIWATVRKKIKTDFIFCNRLHLTPPPHPHIHTQPDMTPPSTKAYKKFATDIKI